MSWKVHDTDDVFAALRGLCSNSYRMYDPSEYRYYYDHECDAYECAVEDAASEYERLLRHCDHQREQLARYEKKEDGMDNIDGGTEIERIRSSITDELRGYVQDWRDTPSLMDDLDRGDIDGILEDFIRIADRIDEQYNRTCRALDSAWSATAHEVLEQAIDELSDEWVKLPVDADGVPIHIGDYVKTLIEAFKGERGRVECLTLTEDGWCVDGDAPSTMRHYHAPTVEDVLDEFFGKANLPDGTQTRAEIIAEYAAKLRLAGDE